MTASDGDPRILRARARKAGRDAFRRLGHAQWRSWRYAAPGFADALRHLLDVDAPREDRDAPIWTTPTSRVWKRTLPDPYGGDTVVLKRTLPRRRLRHAFVPTKAVREVVNYAVFKALGFRTADVLAVGDDRAGPVWRGSFIVTRFVPDFPDGRAFMVNGPEADNAPLRDAFIRASLTALARLHAVGFFHKGCRPYNILWQARPAPPASAPAVDLCVIDVASGRFRPRIGFNYCVAHDLARFLELMPLSLEMFHDYLDFYRALRPDLTLSRDALAARIRARCKRGPLVLRKGLIFD